MLGSSRSQVHTNSNENTYTDEEGKVAVKTVDEDLQKKLEEALAGFQELRDHYDNLEFLRNALAKKKGYDFPSAVRACEEQLKQDRCRFAETVVSLL